MGQWTISKYFLYCNVKKLMYLPYSSPLLTCIDRLLEVNILIVIIVVVRIDVVVDVGHSIEYGEGHTSKH